MRAETCIAGEDYGLQCSEQEKRMVFRVTQEHHIAQVRQAAAALAEETGFSRAATFAVATAVSELASNLFFHASGGGMIQISAVEERGGFWLEVLSEDQGPGIPDISLAMQDGYSTRGGLGGGLPGVKRLMDEFEISSKVDVGTRIVTRKWKSAGIVRQTRSG